MGIKSTIRGGLAGIKNYVVGPSSNPGPAIDPMIADSEKQLKPVGSATKKALDNFKVPDSKPPKSFQEPKREDEANPYGMVRPTPADGQARPKSIKVPDSKPQKDKPKDKGDQYKPKPKTRQYQDIPYGEPDPADPQGIKRPDIKPNKSMSQYDGKGQ